MYHIEGKPTARWLMASLHCTVSDFPISNWYRNPGVYCWAVHKGGVTHLYAGSSLNPWNRLYKHATEHRPSCEGTMFLREYTKVTPYEEQLANFEFALQHSHLIGKELVRQEHTIIKGLAERIANRADVVLLNKEMAEVGVPFFPHEYTEKRIIPSILDFKGVYEE